ncbi:MAG: PEP/pyruvate-binding domain-containing protein [Deltaproteobacteria bacterium]|nr:PEP/pyruvate-binding domain-containing protein [Deltaproteobacteria bacterium]
MAFYSHVSTGWDSLDKIIDHLRRGDNVVWQVDKIDEYRKLTSFFVDRAISNNERVVYMRFARHVPLLDSNGNVTVYNLNIDAGFESFSAEVHSIVTKEGKDVFYVFDSLSDLLHVWATDQMIVNFFFITCPYLFQLNTIAYFAILRNRHSFKAIARIRETTQVLIDVYSYKRQLCIHPIKIQNRYSPTMFFPHIKKKSALVPVINSVEATQLFSHLLRDNTVDSHRNLDFWDRLFIQAEDLLQSNARPDEKQDMVEQLSRLLLSKNKRVLALIKNNLALEDLLQIKERLIGTGFIGGKALGMLLSRKILMKDASYKWQKVLEHHDSFYIGSDVFYSYIVQNGWWNLFMEHKTREGYFTKAVELKNNILKGILPEMIMEQFQRMLEYFGQSPIIVRSSSLLEDAFGSAFAGKYESYFCVNQASPEKRYENFEEAVKHIFASAMNEDALAYRLQRGLDQMDEQMALLVQRVSGAYHKRYFFPEMAGVGLSHNPYVWKKNMDANAGMLRLVMGLGTRAVNRVENDYPRIVAMDDPLVKPLTGMKDIQKYSQHYVDHLNLEANELQTIALRELIGEELDIKLEAMGVRNIETTEIVMDWKKAETGQWVLTFDPFLTTTPFIDIMARMLKTLQNAYKVPVDIEFTVNYNQSDEIQVNLLQCRPFQTIGDGADVSIPEHIALEDTFIRTEGRFMGGNVSLPISCIIFVDPEKYAELSMSAKYSVARLIGKLNRLVVDRKTNPTLLVGPGRWGTHSPAMGVPVTFSEINHITALAEVSYQDGSLIPDLSFGTHFFHDLTETNIFYMAVYPEDPSVVFQPERLEKLPNTLKDISPLDGGMEAVVKVCDLRDNQLMIKSNIISQVMICYHDRE